MITGAVVSIKLVVDDLTKVVAMMGSTAVVMTELVVTLLLVVAPLVLAARLETAVLATVIKAVAVVVLAVVEALVGVRLDEDQGQGNALVDFDLPLVFVVFVLDNGVLVSGPQGGYENVNIEMRILAIDEGV